MMDNLHKQLNIAMDYLAIPKSTNPAAWAFERISQYINDFENELDPDDEIALALVSHDSGRTFHVTDVGYWGPDIVTFDGVDEKGHKLQLIQHVSQLSLLLVAAKKIGPTARRIGFELLKKKAPPSQSNREESSP